MDLASLEPTKEGVTLPLRHPLTDEPLKTEKGNPITVTLLGMDSDAFRSRQRKIINKRLKAGKKAVITAESVEEEALEALAACVLGWQNVILDGRDLEYSHDNVKLLFSRLPWLREQIDEAVANRENFLTASSAS